MKPKMLLPILVITAVSSTAVACSSDAADDAQTVASDVAASLPVETLTIDTLSSISEEDVDQRVDAVGDALRAGDFTTMLDLLELSGVSDELEGREVTILAPSESAFTDLDAGDLSELVTDPGNAGDLIRRHVLDAVYSYDELRELSEVTTISGQTLTLTTDGDAVVIGGATVTAPASDTVAGEQGQEAAVFGIDRLLVAE